MALLHSSISATKKRSFVPSQRFFGDNPNFNATEIYELTFFPESIVTQMVQNFYNFFNPTMFWLMYIQFYERLGPIFVSTTAEEIPNIGALSAAEFNISRKIAEIGEITQLLLDENPTLNTFTGEVSPMLYENEMQDTTTSNIGLISDDERTTMLQKNDTEYAKILMEFVQTMEYSAVLAENGAIDNRTTTNNLTTDSENVNDNIQMFYKKPKVKSKVSFVDVPDFNVTAIYEFTFSPDGISVQLIQGFFVWLTSSLFWIYSTPFFGRLAPIFSVANNEKRLGPDDVTINRVYLKPKSSFKLIKDVKFLLFGNEQSMFRQGSSECN